MLKSISRGAGDEKYHTFVQKGHMAGGIVKWLVPRARLLVERVQRMFCFACIIAVVWWQLPIMLRSIYEAHILSS